MPSSCTEEKGAGRRPSPTFMDTNPPPPGPVDAKPSTATAELFSCLCGAPSVPACPPPPPQSTDHRGRGFSQLLKGIFWWQKAFLVAEGELLLFSSQGSSSLCEE